MNFSADSNQDMGNHTSAISTDTVVEITTEACGSFSKEFASAFKDSIIDSLKTIEKPVQQTRKLLAAPLPDQLIKTGKVYSTARKTQVISL